MKQRHKKWSVKAKDTVLAEFETQKEGLAFIKHKATPPKSKPKRPKRKTAARKPKRTAAKRSLTAYQKFVKEKRGGGYSMAETAQLWKKEKANPRRRRRR